VRQGTTAVQHESAAPLRPPTAPVLAEAAALDTAVPRRDPPPPLGDRLVGPWLGPRQLLAAWLVGRHAARPLRERQGQEAQRLEEPAPGGAGRGRRGGQALGLGAVALGSAQQEEDEQGMDSQDRFPRGLFFLAALTWGLCRRGVGADDPPFCPGMGHRGRPGGAAGTGTPGVGSSSPRGVPTVAAAAAETPRRCARAGRERGGASPRVRNAASSAGSRTCASMGGRCSGPGRTNAHAPPRAQRFAERPA